MSPAYHVWWPIRVASIVKTNRGEAFRLSTTAPFAEIPSPSPHSLAANSPKVGKGGIGRSRCMRRFSSSQVLNLSLTLPCGPRRTPQPDTPRSLQAIRGIQCEACEPPPHSRQHPASGLVAFHRIRGIRITIHGRRLMLHEPDPNGAKLTPVVVSPTCIRLTGKTEMAHAETRRRGESERS